MVVCITGMICVTVIALYSNITPENMKYVIGGIAAMVSSFCVGQGIADSGSMGKTSSIANAVDLKKTALLANPK